MPVHRFHNRTGSMVTLSNSNTCAERKEPHREFNNGLVLSSEPLQNERVFAVRIDKKVSSWSGSIEIGLTTFDPMLLDFPSSATNLRRGAWVMSGTSILKDGKSIFDECPDDLDELVEGDIVGIMRSSSGSLHFYINGVDQGSVDEMHSTCAVYAVIDLYGKCTKVSIIESIEISPTLSIAVTNRSGELQSQATPIISLPRDHLSSRLRFHRRCGPMVRLSNDNRTAERRKPVYEFNNAVVMTHRPVKDNELFQIQIDELIHKWSGSIEMGITTHNPDILDFPATMTNMRSGTIMMSGCGILTNGKGSKREYGEFNLDELRVGDRIGLMRKSNGSLHYYINGLDQGIAATNVPTVVYGVVDLYGMTVKVSINDNLSGGIASRGGIRARTPLSQPNHSLNFNSLSSAITEPLVFHHRCGDYVKIINSGRTAIRPNCLDDFNYAVVLTNRALRHDEFFQVIVEEVVTKWAGSIEIGVTTHTPHELDFPATMTNVRTGTWMMTGNGIMHNGTTIIDVYGHSLDKLKSGDRVGLVVSKLGKLNFFINGIDQGLAACNIPNGVYGVIDLYGQAAKASIVHNTISTALDEAGSSMGYNHHSYRRNQCVAALPKRPFSSHVGKEVVGLINESFKSGNITKDRDGLLHYYHDEDSSISETPSDPTNVFHRTCGPHLKFKCGGNMAIRSSSVRNSLLFSSKPLEEEGYFEVQIVTTNPKWHGSLIIGLTNFEPFHSHLVPECSLKFQPYETWLLFGNDFYRNGKLVKEKYAPGFWRAMAGDKAGLRKEKNGNLYFSLNGQDFGIAARNVPPNLHVVCDLYGITEALRISQSNLPPYVPKDDSLIFHIRHGRNVKLLNDRRSAQRTSGHMNAVVVTNRSLKPGELFEIHIDNLDKEWPQSLRIGVTNRSPEKWHLSLNELPDDECSWLVIRDKVVHKRKVVRAKYGPNLNILNEGQAVGLKVENSKKLYLYIDGESQGVAAEGIAFPAYVFVDLFGRCTQVSFSEMKHLEKAEEEDKEKTDIENGIKESVLNKFLAPEEPVYRCSFKDSCFRIKNLLFPNGFFLLDLETCYCNTCHRFRGDPPYFKKGNPPKEYAQPLGWCYFALRPFCQERNYNNTWHIAYHGTKLGCARRILDNRSLLPADRLGIQRLTIAQKNEKDARFSHVFMSPSLRYAACSKFAPESKIRDPKSQKELRFHMAFQVYVRPGSYTTASVPQFPTHEPFDNHINSTDLEWYTKEDGTTVLHGLLIRLADS